ncbi:MAG: hypothetical protein ABIE23_05950 [archaeon]|nr:hypothetical protein [Candidatus Micrarchaeota archaeon]
MRLPVVSGKEMLKFLQSKGFSVARQKGSHTSLYRKTFEKLYCGCSNEKGNKTRDIIKHIKAIKYF